MTRGDRLTWTEGEGQAHVGSGEYRRCVCCVLQRLNDKAKTGLLNPNIQVERTLVGSTSTPGHREPWFDFCSWYTLHDADAQRGIQGYEWEPTSF